MEEKVKKTEKIAALYSQGGFSMAQIAEQLGLTVSGVRHHLDKGGVKRRTISEAITRVYQTKFNKKPFVLPEVLTSEQEKLKLAVLMLYWGEGTKGGNGVALSNSDPQMIKLFVQFLREICGIEESRLRVTLHLYPDHDEKTLKEFWSSLTDIPLTQFNKPFVHRDTKGSYKKKSQYGTVEVRYSDILLIKLILGWLIDSKREFGLLR